MGAIYTKRRTKGEECDLVPALGCCLSQAAQCFKQQEQGEL
jgi:hypothetical protein